METNFATVLDIRKFLNGISSDEHDVDAVFINCPIRLESFFEMPTSEVVDLNFMGSVVVGDKVMAFSDAYHKYHEWVDNDTLVVPSRSRARAIQILSLNGITATAIPKQPLSF